MGSATADACEDAGMQVVVLDRRVRPAAHRRRHMYTGDVGDAVLVDRLLADHPDIEVVLHAAARASAPQSREDPLRCYQDNVADTIGFLRSLQRAGVARVLFSSSSAVYMQHGSESLREDSAVEWGSPYSSSKLMCERVLRDAARSGAFRAVALRYANIIGRGSDRRTGARVRSDGSVLRSLMAAADAGEAFTIMGTDWPTRDGSALRDFIHVRDVAMANVAAIRRFDGVAHVSDPYRVVNIGTGEGTTVRELVTAFEHVTGRRVRLIEGDPRPADGVGSVMNVDRAFDLLGWRSTRSIHDAIRDAVRGDGSLDR